MAYEQKPNRGSLFKNSEKDSAEDRDYAGSININGEDFWWCAESPSGFEVQSCLRQPPAMGVAGRTAKRSRVLALARSDDGEIVVAWPRTVDVAIEAHKRWCRRRDAERIGRARCVIAIIAIWITIVFRCD